MNQPTCFKSAIPSCIDLVLNTKKLFFMRSETVKFGLSDFHNFTTTILRKTISKGTFKTILYRGLLTKTNLMKK